MNACVATAPTPVLICGTMAPTAKNRVATMIPTRCLAPSRAMIDQVTDLCSGCLAVDNALAIVRSIGHDRIGPRFGASPRPAKPVTQAMDAQERGPLAPGTDGAPASSAPHDRLLHPQVPACRGRGGVAWHGRRHRLLYGDGPPHG